MTIFLRSRFYLTPYKKNFKGRFTKLILRV